ncbi:MAG: CPBP family intramembrane metalloprotease [Chloroflexi bacterium]|jgi:uncharacterized protein|nr:CPBP family intramembrane metalloprotease [Chloroflexota bacterium]MBT3669991.1 CPBP family intramembrane metalloprotease [Chloroflexota bacterium]MBT4003903.1 CPBP family intramembrane metalloprotease [Chloroflexota bacterium]MBT4306504.1 CPBP family intramembrane metalloprotease [Chloroflexota bacterium]MBT4534605.1 CPBP family intramembrane metalloprotease [Chloroflexota bacterium]
MSEINPEKLLEESETLEKGTGADLVLYLLGGFGLFLLAGILVGPLFDEITLGLTTLSIIFNLLFVGGSAYILGIRRNKISWKQLGIKPVVWKWEYILLAGVLAVALMPIRSAIGLLVQMAIEGGVDSLIQRENLLSAGGLTWGGFLVMFIGVGILAPISEELYFRGLLHDWFRQRWGMWASIIASSVFFGLAHFDSIGVLVSSFIMGIAMAYVYEKTKTLWITIAIHIITNSIAVFLLYLSMIVVEYFDIPGL